MAEREPARVIETGIEFMLEEEADLPPDPPELASLPMTPEDRAEQARREMIEVRAQEYADVETAEGVARWRGASIGTAVDVAQQRDPALGLLELVDEVRMNSPFGDLRRCDFDVTRWEYYSAPHRLVLSDKLRERLGRRL